MANMTTLLKCQHADHKYESADGFTLEREYGKTPNDNNMNGRWVLRDSDGKMIDFDQYRNDLVERQDCQLATGWVG